VSTSASRVSLPLLPVTPSSRISQTPNWPTNNSSRASLYLRSGKTPTQRKDWTTPGRQPASQRKSFYSKTTLSSTPSSHYKSHDWATPVPPSTLKKRQQMKFPLPSLDALASTMSITTAFALTLSMDEDPLNTTASMTHTNSLSHQPLASPFQSMRDFHLDVEDTPHKALSPHTFDFSLCGKDLRGELSEDGEDSDDEERNHEEKEVEEESDENSGTFCFVLYCFVSCSSIFVFFLFRCFLFSHGCRI
jgi:hypothetical protein